MAMNVDPGEMNERITIQEVTRSSDGAGGATETWANISSTPKMWAKVRPMSGQERDHAQQTQAGADMVVIIRYRSDLSEGMRIVWRSQNLNIRYIADYGPTSQFLMLECQRGRET